MSEEKPNFEAQLGELEKIVEQLERGELSLEDSVSLFERGTQLSESCRTQLASAESRIHILLNPRERGPVRTEVFAVDEGEEEQD